MDINALVNLQANNIIQSNIQNVTNDDLNSFIDIFNGLLSTNMTSNKQPLVIQNELSQVPQIIKNISINESNFINIDDFEVKNLEGMDVLDNLNSGEMELFNNKTCLSMDILEDKNVGSINILEDNIEVNDTSINENVETFVEKNDKSKNKQIDVDEIVENVLKILGDEPGVIQDVQKIDDDFSESKQNNQNKEFLGKSIENLLDALHGEISIKQITFEDGTTICEKEVLPNQTTSTNQSELINQIEDYVNKHYDDFKIGTKIEIKLNPESLGKLDINVIQKNDTILIKFNVENSDVTKMLDNQVQKLEQIFKNISTNEQEIKVVINESFNSETKEQKKNDRKKQDQLKYKNLKMRGKYL